MISACQVTNNFILGFIIFDNTEQIVEKGQDAEYVLHQTCRNFSKQKLNILWKMQRFQLQIEMDKLSL